MKKSEIKPNQKLFASIPSMTVLLQHERTLSLVDKYPESYVQERLRRAVDEVRQQILDGWITDTTAIPSLDKIISRAEKMIAEGLGNKLMRAVNGAGVVLHTGLGRAPLSLSAQDSLHEAARRYCILATERESGKRGDRNRHNEELLCEITGAEAALIVNNNSAAVMLALNTFGKDRESVVSRGELVEIGGAFRVPDVMRRSQTIMVEVGTTNKTHLKDYRNAITENTSIFLKVHTSNYRIEGFHKEVNVAEMSELAHEHGLHVVMDIGSGALVDLRRWGLAYEPLVQEAVKDGADIITFSGDKMVGGPQAGIIVGRKELIDEMKVNPLMRAFRCGKLTHSALNGTLRLFLDPDKLVETHPVYMMIGAPMDVINRRAQRIARRLRKIVNAEVIGVEIIDGFTEMGSGSLPARGIPTRYVALDPKKCSAEKLTRELRMATPPFFTRIENERTLIDARTIADDEVPMIDRSLKCALDTLKLS